MASRTSARQQEMSQRATVFKGCYAPAFKGDCEDRPYHAGTIMSVAFPDRNVFVTARHVLDRDWNNPCDDENQIHVFSSGTIKQIQRFTYPKGELDLTVIHTQDVDARDVFAEPLDHRHLLNRPLTTDMYVAACGFPRTKNYRKGKQLTCRPYGYFGRVLSDATTKRAGYDPTSHFSLRFNRKRSVNEDGRGGYAPDPDGISGGPAFLVDDLATDAPTQPALAGIVIARDPKLKLLICIRAECISFTAGDSCSEGSMAP